MTLQIDQVMEARVEEAARKQGESVDQFVRKALESRVAEADRCETTDSETVQDAWDDFIGVVSVEDAPAGRDAEQEFGRLLMEKRAGRRLRLSLTPNRSSPS